LGDLAAPDVGKRKIAMDEAIKRFELNGKRITKARKNENAKGGETVTGERGSFPVFLGLSLFRAFVIGRLPCQTAEKSLGP